MDLAINVDSRLVFYIKLYTIEGIHNIVRFVSKLESFCLMIFSINPKKNYLSLKIRVLKINIDLKNK